MGWVHGYHSRTTDTGQAWRERAPCLDVVVQGRDLTWTLRAMPAPQWVVLNWPGSATIIAMRCQGIGEDKPVDESVTTSPVCAPAPKLCSSTCLTAVDRMGQRPCVGDALELPNLVVAKNQRRHQAINRDQTTELSHRRHSLFWLSFLGRDTGRNLSCHGWRSLVALQIPISFVPRACPLSLAPGLLPMRWSARIALLNCGKSWRSPE